MSDFSDLTAHGLVGIVGVALYIGTYAALQFGFLRGRGYAYAGLNLTASACVLISLTKDFNLSSALIQACWIVISAVGMIRYYILSNHMRYTAEEEALLKDTLPHLPPSKARKFLDMGVWVDGPEGMVLTQQGQPNRDLVYIAAGEASVVSHGAIVATCHDKTLIGELTVFSGDAATATVSLTKPSRLFVVSALTLRAQARRDPEMHAYLESSFSAQMVEKIKRNTLALAQQGKRAELRF